ncbi:hypothetical protein ACE38W_11990 [Chitinophaga sp. Hz27]|uniref:hypothetical protein n=1 Tax=Chitinophaga sp. Hz27 TaxID=3347169 RepID=UPI0035D9488A
MKRALLFLGSLLLTVSAVAQEMRNTTDLSTLIIYAKEYNKGLYRSFKDFQTNSPSENGDLVIIDRSTAAQTYLLADKNQLVIRDGAGEHKVKDYWGYCDGRNLYVKDNGLNKIIETGYYCIYRQHGQQASRGYYNPADMTVNNISNPVELVKVINIMTGEIYDLSAYNLRKYILPQDNELLEEFRSDKEKKDKLEYYIRRFNQRNKPTI